MSGYDELQDDSKLWLENATLHTRTTSDGVDLYLGVDRVQPDEYQARFDDIRALIKFTADTPTDKGPTNEAFDVAFRGLWRAINLLQHLPGLHIEYPMMDTLDTPSSLATVDAVEEDAQWVAIKADALEGYHPLINAMIAADIPCPDRVGEDVMDGNRVVTMATGLARH